MKKGTPVIKGFTSRRVREHEHPIFQSKKREW